MKREDLFLAIGEVEEERLQRSELGVPSGNHLEGNKMGKFETKRTGKRIIRNLLIAAVIVSLMATTVFAYTAFVVYENPRAMLEAFFGVQPAPHGPDCNCADCRATAPTYERVELNQEAANEMVVPYISEVGDSFVYEDMYRFTVDAHTYDSATGCGLLYYTMERTEASAEYPIDYQLQESGEIWGIGNHLNVPYCPYLIQSESTPYKLKIAAYYINDNADNLVFHFGNAEIYDNDTHELIGYDPNLSIILPFEDGGGMKSLTLADGGIVLSPIGIVVKGSVQGVTEGVTGEPQIDHVTIRYTDGTEYLVENNRNGNLTCNYGYALMELQGEVKVTYALNRIVEIDKVASIIINDTEFPVG